MFETDVVEVYLNIWLRKLLFAFTISKAKCNLGDQAWDCMIKFKDTYRQKRGLAIEDIRNEFANSRSPL